MKPGDLVRNKNSESGELGLFIGTRIFRASNSNDPRDVYACAEVMWFNRNALNGDRVSTIQPDLIEVVNE
tara:strand:+ start:51 stop:260 length:210 start_codon:yes stop_codon:yes gene_type:complete